MIPGMYVSPQSIIYIDATVADDPVRQSLSRILAHEIGHMVDVTRMDDDARAQFMSMRGFDPSMDWRDSSAPWADRPQEDFAEVYAAIDSPFSLWPIQTVGGRMHDEAGLRTLIERFQRSPSRPREGLNLSALKSQANSALQMVKNDTFVLEILLGMAVVYASVSAIQSMQDAHW